MADEPLQRERKRAGVAETQNKGGTGCVIQLGGRKERLDLS